jgi:hypothetical protein
VMPGQKKRPEAEEEHRRDKRPVDGTPFSALPRSSGRFAFPPTYSADNQPVKAFSRAMSGTHDLTAPESISNAFRHPPSLCRLNGVLPVIQRSATEPCAAHLFALVRPL